MTRLARMVAVTAAWITWGVAPARADWGEPSPPVTLRLDAGYHVATDGTQLGLVLGTMHFDIPHNYYLGDPFYEVTGGMGWVSGVESAHSIAVRIGSGGIGYLQEFLWGTCGGICHKQLMGVSTGVALDRAGERMPAAWTIPIDGYVYVRTSERATLGPIAGVSWAFAGADRALGLRAGLDLVVAGLSAGDTILDPRNLHVRVEAQRFDGATFVGITVGLEGMNRYDRFFESKE